MKTRLLIIIGIIVGTGIMMFTFDGEYNSATNNAYGMWRPLSPESLIEESKTVFVGIITAITPIDVEYQSQIARDGTSKDGVGPEVMTLEEYTVSVEEYLKNVQDLDTLKVLSATVGGVPSGPSRISGFEIGDRVLFYLPNNENQTHFANQYLPESFKIPKHCNAKTVLEQPRIDGANDFRMMQDGVAMQDNFTANKKIQFVFDKDMRTLDGAGFNVDVAISKVLGKNDYQPILKESIRVESQTCEWVTTAQWDFVPTAGEYDMWMKYGKEGDSGYTTGSSSFSVVGSMSGVTSDELISPTRSIIPCHGCHHPGHAMSPLKQIKSGILIENIHCRESLVLMAKHDGSPACVTPETVEKLIQRNWTISNNENLLFEIITPESQLATFYAQPQITSVILKQDSTIRTHLFSYVKEPDGWDMVFDRIFDEIPKNFKIGIVENTPENIHKFVTLGKENLPSGIKAELLREDGYFVVYLTSNKSLEPGNYDLSIVSVDKAGEIIQKPLFVIAVDANITPTQDITVKIQHNKGSWGIDFENISEQEYWIREDQRTPWPPSPILDITQDNIHPDVKELIDFMWSQDAKYIPSEYDKNTLMVQNKSNFSADPEKIRDWLEITYVQQFQRNLDDSFSSYIKYDDKIYSFGFVIAD